MASAYQLSWRELHCGGDCSPTYQATHAPVSCGVLQDTVIGDRSATYWVTTVGSRKHRKGNAMNAESVFAVVGALCLVYGIWGKKIHIKFKEFEINMTEALTAAQRLAFVALGILLLLPPGLSLVGIKMPLSSPAPAQSATTPNVRVLPVSTVERHLADANIVLSTGGEADVNRVRGWMQNDDAYKALAQLTLDMMAGKQAVDPIPLDVINGKYKELFGVPGDGYLTPDKYTDREKLQDAIFRAWRESHPTAPAQSFSDIVTTRTP